MDQNINSPQFLSRYSEEKFYCEAMSDYLHTVQENYAKMIEVLTEAACYDELPEGQTLDQYINNLITEKGLHPQAVVSFKEGYSNLGDVAMCIAENVDEYADVENADSASYLNSGVLDLVDNVGTSVATKLSVNEIFEQTKAFFHSTACFSAAYNSASVQDMNARMTTFKDKVQSQFTNIFDDISGTCNSLLTMLGNSFFNTASFIQSTMKMLGVDAQAEQDNFVLNDTEIVEYTGATPVPAINLTKSLDVIGAAFTFVWEGVKRLFNFGASKVKEKVVTTVVDTVNAGMDPIDIGVLDAKAESSTVNGWGISRTNTTFSTPQLSSSYGNITVTNDDFQAWINSLSSKYDNWIKFNFIGGELLFSIDEVEQSGSALIGQFSYKFKPKPIANVALMAAFESAGWTVTRQHISGSDTDATDGFTINSRNFNTVDDADKAVCDLIDYLKTQVYNNLTFKSKMNTNTGETELLPEYADAKAYINGYVLTKMLADLSKTCMANTQNHSVSVSSYTFHAPQDGTMTNSKWIRLLSGWDGNTSSPNFSSFIPVHGGSFSISSIAEDLACCFVLQQLAQLFFPTEFPFLPYRNNVADFDTSKYYIKTDSENQAAWEHFLNTVVTVIIVAVVAISITVAISFVRKKLFFKKAEYVGRLDNKMWNGGKLTASERRKYTRYSRKLNASSLLTGGIQESSLSAASAFSNNSNDTLSTAINQVYTSVRG